MANKPANVITRTDLTNYAFAVMQDAQKIRDLANLLAPVVPTGTPTGRYNKFDTTASFKAYANARRAVGGQANAITFLSDTANFAADPYGLRISIDQHERAQAGESANLLEQGKVRTLTINCLLAHLQAIATEVLADVSAVANVGDWSSGNTDPIAELDAQILAMWKASGILPNNLVLDFGAWVILRNNPKLFARMPGADVAFLSTERLSSMLSAPLKVTIADAAVLTGGGLGNAAATKTGPLGSTALLFYNSASATQYDPSFAKTFAPSANLFTEVYSFEEQPHLTWFENDWTADVEVVSSTLARRITVS